MFLRKIYGAMMALAFCIGLVPACGSGNRTVNIPEPALDKNKFNTNTPPTNPGNGEFMKLCVEALGSCATLPEGVVASAAIVAPPPGTVAACGSFAMGTGNDMPDDCIDVSSFVSGGILTLNQSVSMGRTHTIFIFVNGRQVPINAINGVPVTANYCVIMLSGVEYFTPGPIVGRDQDATVLTLLNPNCTESVYSIEVFANGNSNVDDTLYDEPEVKDTGTLPGNIDTIGWSTLYLDLTSFDPVTVNPIPYSAPLTAYAETYYMASTQRSLHSMKRPDPSPICQPPFAPCPHAQMPATWARVMDGVTEICRAELIHWVDTNMTLQVVDSAIEIEGVDPGGTCITQDADNRNDNIDNLGD